MLRLIVLLATANLLAPPLPPQPGQDEHPSRLIVVRMVDKSPTEFAFEPSDITVHPGDTIRFVQTGVMPHNVEFTSAPSGAALDGIRTGPYLTRPDQTWDIVVDGRFPGGEYPFICTPHQFLGMTGLLTVAPPAEAEPTPSPESDR